MQSFHTLTSPMIPLPYDDIDTDQIIPAQYLKVTDKRGLAEGLFAGWRFLPSGEEDPDFPLNQPQYKDARVLLVGDNFGCGSSREHAPWALAAWGIRAVISTSFADIFRNNALKNGLLPVVVEDCILTHLFEQVREDPRIEVTVDLPAQVLVLPGGSEVSFPIEPFNKKCLLEGIDPLDYLLKHESNIMAFENMRFLIGASEDYSTKHMRVTENPKGR